MTDMYTLSLSPRLHAMRTRRLALHALVALLLLFLLLGLYNVHRRRSVPLDTMMPGEPRYGIIFDAGSTGSRVHVFEFRYVHGRNQPYILVNELFKQVRPGLSSYSKDPREAARSIRQLIEACKSRIPPRYWSKTPLALKATAGLRLLKADTAKKILEEIRRTLAEYPFALDKDAVEIMDGLDEGIFSWVTLNFLNGKMAHPDESFGALDLGGGSTQVTFAQPIGLAPPGFVKNFKLGSTTVRLYSHSYLGLGLMAARWAVLKAGNSKSSQTARSPCLPAGISTQWSYAGVALNVTGQGLGYEACRQLANQVVTQLGVHAPERISSRKFYAFSYFYDRASELGLISESDGGEVTLDSLISAARDACNSPKPAAQPFLCLDMSYITELLRNGYKFDKSASFTMRKKIRNVELSWALGAVFDIFYNHVHNGTTTLEVSPFT